MLQCDPETTLQSKNQSPSAHGYPRGIYRITMGAANAAASDFSPTETKGNV